MKNDNGLCSISIIIKPIALFIFFLVLSSCNTNNKPLVEKDNAAVTIAVEEKQKGVHYFGILDSTAFQALKQNNFEWISLVSWANQNNYDSPVLSHHNGDSTQIRLHETRWIKRIELAHSAGFKVFLKPHVWITSHSNGKWRSDIYPTNEENWEIWKSNYRDFILRYAKIAEQSNVELFCIGTEFSKLTIEKPIFWKNLIKEIRIIYSGKITYAANWYNEYENISFWDDLDYIGIQAYFPLVKNKYPSVAELSKGWNAHLPILDSTAKKFNRKVLFTEMGYRSTAESAIKPWLWLEKSSNLNESISLETQVNCYDAFFNSVWNKEWFAGVHIWQMRNYSGKDMTNDFNFSPQGKLAEQIIAKGFK